MMMILMMSKVVAVVVLDEVLIVVVVEAVGLDVEESAEQMNLVKSFCQCCIEW